MLNQKGNNEAEKAKLHDESQNQSHQKILPGEINNITVVSLIVFFFNFEVF